MAARGLLIALLLLVVSPQTQPRLPLHVESLDYPPLARYARITGDVSLAVAVDSDGRITGWPNVLTGHPLLVQAAEENLRTWRFQPGANSEVKVTYDFKLEGQSTIYPTSVCKFDLPDSVMIVAHPPQPETSYSSNEKPESNRH